MSREAIEELIDRWMDDPAFRAAVRQDPEAALRSAGVQLDADEWAAVRGIDPMRRTYRGHHNFASSERDPK